ncbi:hypothetical protein NKCBBBOE_01668 [Pseudarthrobacter sp. MM222]|nr:hypothetical protein NKCBBBOE_01668 [Pseudarthrobacter sp. MM222]
MRIIRLGASDPRFRTVNFHPGKKLNLLIADKTRATGVGDSRNGTGKTAMALIVRYLLGGNKPSKLAKAPELAAHEFFGVFEMLGSNGQPERVTVRRSFKSTKVTVEGWSRVSAEPMSMGEWTTLLARHVFRLPEGLERPTLGQLVGQFVRTDFLPTKVHVTEADWESGCRYAFLFGIDAGIAAEAGEVARLTGQQKALSQAAKNGALADLKLDVAGLRGRLVTARREREDAGLELANFRVEDRYQDHQVRANALSKEIRDLNEQELILQRRLSDLDRALEEESVHGTDRLGRATQAVYSEAGIAFSDVALKRFEDVQAFHASVIRNRRLFLQNERGEITSGLRSVQTTRNNLDEERSSLMILLQESVALDTYLAAQASLTTLDAEIAGIEDRLRMAERFENLGEDREAKAVETRRRMRLEIAEQEPRLDQARALFGDLAAEIYGHGSGKTKRASLDLGVSPRQGNFLVNPEIAADGSAGISSVKTFIMDMVTMCMAQKTGHSLGFLIHDSGLFDPVDSEQIASCLNIGSRLAEEWGFQYVVTMNSDDLRSAILDSGGAFDEEPHLLELRLSDQEDEQKLFGFGFD